ncbi:universal stress protein [Marinobacter halophilus]|uniref:Universal stress protein UspA n=1 Tax=Marinobacter halophilus TaxID=1323740 RepID=A0A2T1KFF6_9GAMM|nr:universal stress protein [Marinobacter halophilus]PSF08861.1 universal stress protein UspA [Marinobacter halophilus]GGC64572.1 universal stress protein A [Marinobacter halophilus]
MTLENSKTGDQKPLHVVACIDASKSSLGVCDYAAWASQRMGDPLTLLHALDEEKYPAKTDMTGNIGLGSREQLQEELASLDRERSKLALKHGHLLLDEAEKRVLASSGGIESVTKRQRHNDLANSLIELEPESRLFVLGLQGESSTAVGRHIGSQLETVIRSVHRPVFLVPDEFSEPRSAMLAFDGSATAFRSIELLAGTPVFKGMPLHLVMVDSDTEEHRAQLKRAEEALAGQNTDVHLAIREGDVEETLHAYQEEHDIDVLIMGAYGHSRIRRFLVGSTTTRMLETAKKPLVILR